MVNCEIQYNMHKTLTFILAITVLAGLCDATGDPISFDSLPQAVQRSGLQRSKPIEIINEGIRAFLCRHDDCRVMSHESLASRLYGTLFNVTSYSKKSGLRYVPTARSGNGTSNPCSLPGIVPNGDYCCPTTRYFTCFNTSQEISNPQSESCLVIALHNTFQCVSSAACCGGGTCSRQGRSCKLEIDMQSLFVWNLESGKLQFELFKFPAYCACKSN